MGSVMGLLTTKTVFFLMITIKYTPLANGGRNSGYLNGVCRYMWALSTIGLLTGFQQYVLQSVPRCVLHFFSDKYLTALHCSWKLKYDTNKLHEVYVWEFSNNTKVDGMYVAFSDRITSPLLHLAFPCIETSLSERYFLVWPRYLSQKLLNIWWHYRTCNTYGSLSCQ